MNQLGRRNLTSQEASYYRGKLYESRKLNHGGDRKSKGQNVLLKTTAEKIAEEYGVTDKTIKRDAEFSKAVDKVAEKVGKEAKNINKVMNSSVQNAHLKKTAEQIGKEYGVSEKTIRNDAKFNKAIDF